MPSSPGAQPAPFPVNSEGRRPSELVAGAAIWVLIKLDRSVVLRINVIIREGVRMRAVSDRGQRDHDVAPGR